MIKYGEVETTGKVVVAYFKALLHHSSRKSVVGIRLATD
jgi:hypothetical protein